MLRIKRIEKVTDNHIKEKKGKTYIKDEVLKIRRTMILNFVDLAGTIYYLRESLFRRGN